MEEVLVKIINDWWALWRISTPSWSRGWETQLQMIEHHRGRDPHIFWVVHSSTMMSFVHCINAGAAVSLFSTWYHSTVWCTQSPLYVVGRELQQQWHSYGCGTCPLEWTLELLLWQLGWEMWRTIPHVHRQCGLTQTWEWSKKCRRRS